MVEQNRIVICKKYFFIFEKKKRNKHSHIQPILGGFAKVCFGYKRLSGHWYDEYKQNHTFDGAVSEKPKTSRINFKNRKYDKKQIKTLISVAGRTAVG